MNDKTINKLILIQENIKKLNIKNETLPQIICISKTFGLSKISSLSSQRQHQSGVCDLGEDFDEFRPVRDSPS